ncbi:MAG: carbonic anhydrase, partial [Streptomyces sp.]
GKAHHIDARKDVDIHYGKTTVELENDGHTVKGNVAGGNRISIAGTSYELEQFHFHLPSEHTIDHKGTAMEMHFVNKNAKGRVAVLSMLMDQKGANSPFGSLWKSLPKKHNTTAKVHGGIDLNSFVPKDRAEFQYAGSLTTPPCSESVNWVVFKKPLTVTAGQVDAYHDLYPKSNRPVQHLDGRTVDDTDK